jgi:transglutaminase-like putative cysteine protease/Flp pilus assembly protein TadD
VLSKRYVCCMPKALFCLGLMFFSSGIYGQDVWNQPAFSADEKALRMAAAEIKPDKDAGTTFLLNEFNLSLDAKGALRQKRHTIYRIETKDAVEGWSEIREEWDPWHQMKPEIHARVLSPDGVIHVLDPKTLAELAVNEDSPDTYSDRRAYGGPLPALTPGAIVEEEIVSQDTAPFFSGGTINRYVLARTSPVKKTRISIFHPESLPIHYVLRLLPDAKVDKKLSDGGENITIEQGPMEAYKSAPKYLPPDAVLYPEIDIWTADSWRQIAAEYSRQINSRFQISDVQPFLAKLELATASNLEKIGRIADALHRSVRYTGIEFGESGLIPHFPAETLKHRYGDCKDKATLLITMLRAAGIPSNLALLSAGPGKDIDPGQPGMGNFDHAIVHVPATDSSPELWIDATDEYARPGELPTMDYGRWALIAEENTTGLIRIPELTSKDNLHIETREFTLADYGPAHIYEKDEQLGPTEEEYRSYYGGDAKKVREGNEKYTKDEYLADSLGSFEKSDPGDMKKPFVVSFQANGRRGFTALENATVYIPHRGILNGLPNYFYTEEEKDQSKDDASESGEKARTVDWMIKPFTTEWRYKVTAPDGFRIRALPPNRDDQLGTAHFTQTYSSNPDGTVVNAVLRFDSGKARITVEEAKTLRDAIVKARAMNGISINFDQVGQSLLAAGKIKDALAMDRKLVSSHPKDALQRVRLAHVLLAAGLGEKAQAVMKEAVALAPASAQVWSEQGWILEHDVIGRRFGKGFDYVAAVASYRKAKQLDPKDNDIRANLAILLEYDAEGVRYGSKANMEAAITEFKELKQKDESYAQSYENFIPYDLWYLQKFKDVYDYVAALPSTDARHALLLGSVAVVNGPEAAIQRSLEITSEESARSKALVAAGRLLMKVRKYPEAAQLVAAGAHGQAEQSQLTSFATILAKTKPYSELRLEDSNPASVMQDCFALILSGSQDLDKFKALFSSTVLQFSDWKKNESKELQQSASQMRSIAEKSDLTLENVADIALSTARFSTEGDDHIGYKVTIQTIGAAAQEAFVVRENGRYKMVELSSSESKVPENIAWQVLAYLEKGDLDAAKKWLDWAREKVHINTGDDPLSGQPFPHFWTKGQDADPSRMRIAALVLAPSRELKDQNLERLIEARNQAHTESERKDLNLVLAYADASQERWSDLRQVAGNLMQAYPESPAAFQFAVRADLALQQLDDWEKLLTARLEKYKDEPAYIRSAADLARNRGQFAKAREIMKTLIDNGRASENDLNVYAWDALYIPGSVDQEAIDAAKRGSDLTKTSKFPVLHTLACLYAVAGKTSEARELFFKAMDEVHAEEPNEEIWLGLALIAEQYGETDAARSMYGRVEKPKIDSPASSYALARQHLAALQNGSVPAKAVGQ